MKTLILMRHAKSSWDFADLSDHDRPLNKRGRNDAPLMGRELLSREVQPDLIVSSSAVRAITTATLVAHELEYDLNQIKIDSNIYGADCPQLVQIIKAMPEDVDTLLLVGHNPTHTEVANALSPEHVADIPTAGVVSLSFDTSDWADISKDNATLHYFDFPKNHKSK